ncbi:MAG: tRNA (adenosine(37)-N6)-threonylcarbamoyltransferase complex transferase subunit TsaD [Candidatus Blackburnbacteria bacterium]|nr:tRNA (adenosine(37)-N6)-threonylcarbamoyltransferase complex transferase subunit TsaD [Candidatus Blackburnbacteria bacterium]
MIVLGIETSCDETAASVVRDGKEIISNVIASSVEMHAKTGGIIPEQAAREQVKSIIPVINEALGEAKLWDLKQTHIPPIDAIAVTYGPGLIGSLLVGVETARTLAWVWDKPIVPINHLLGHIYANWLDNPSPTLPAIALVVSGGHTDIVLLKDHGEVEWIGGTRDDAAGEAFDKAARLLGLGYPGGPAISAAAEKYEALNSKFEIKLPRPLLDEKTFDFSFSGLKTAVLREVESIKRSHFPLPTTDLAHEVQEAITDVLVAKTLRAVRETGVNTLLIAGGVAANSCLKEKFEEAIRNLPFAISLRVPPSRLCTDNAAMIAAAAEFNYHPIPWQEVTTNPSLTITST